MHAYTIEDYCDGLIADGSQILYWFARRFLQQAHNVFINKSKIHRFDQKIIHLLTFCCGTYVLILVVVVLI